MKNKQNAILLLAFFCLINLQCVAQRLNVLYHPATNSLSVLKIYIDRNGNIYPPDYSIDSTYFYRSTPGLDDIADMEAYFRKAPPVLKQTFPELQKELIASYANVINQQLNISKSKKLVLLIHGFNTITADPDYIRTKAAIAANTKIEDIVFLEVYWDGLYKENGIPFFIWRSAQPNSVFVGLTLRKVLAQVDNNIDLYVVTHSLGASVGTQILFNVQKWNKGFQKKVNDIANGIPTPKQRNITLAMLAPAIPGKNTFDDLDSTIIQRGDNKNYRKIIIGYNKHDYATGKKIRWLLSRRLGATSLGCGPREVMKTGRIIHRTNSQIIYKPIDFSKDTTASIHAMEAYQKCSHYLTFITETFN